MQFTLNFGAIILHSIFPISSFSFSPRCILFSLPLIPINSVLFDEEGFFFPNSLHHHYHHFSSPQNLLIKMLLSKKMRVRVGVCWRNESCWTDMVPWNVVSINCAHQPNINKNAISIITSRGGKKFCANTFHQCKKYSDVSLAYRGKHMLQFQNKRKKKTFFSSC